jgi:hypothetical protein
MNRGEPSNVLERKTEGNALVFGFWVSNALTQRAMPAFRAMPWSERRKEGYAPRVWILGEPCSYPTSHARF